jgi:hypothetical protein
MKSLYAVKLVVLCVLIATVANAQRPVSEQLPDKPLQFSQFPDKSECNVASLKNIFSSRSNDNISLQLGKFQFTGQVIEKVQQSPQVLSMNIRSSNFSGAIFNISIITMPDNSQKLTGQIINPKSGDVLVLTEVNNRYFLEKKLLKFFMTD